MLDSICRAAGYRTALFTSPHLVTFRERIQVNGEMISEDEVVQWPNENSRADCGLGATSDFFRNCHRSCARSFPQFGSGDRRSRDRHGRTTRRDQRDPAGRFRPHADRLRSSEMARRRRLTEIAREKAGIIKPTSSGRLRPAAARSRSSHSPEPRNALRRSISSGSRSNDCRSRSAEPIKNKTPRSPSPRLHTAKIEVNDNAIARGLATVDWPARFQRWDERTIIDGAHNPAGARILAETWRETFGDQEADDCAGRPAGQETSREFAPHSGPIARRCLLPSIRSERALPPEEFA